MSLNAAKLAVADLLINLPVSGSVDKQWLLRVLRDEGHQLSTLEAALSEMKEEGLILIQDREKSAGGNAPRGYDSEQHPPGSRWVAVSPTMRLASWRRTQNDVERVPPSACSLAGPPESKGRNMSGNPLHYLIATLTQFFDAVWKCHHAQTEAEMKLTRTAWRDAKAWFWPRFRRPTEAIRGLADPALAWCSRKGFRRKEHVATVENAANFITELAKLTSPCAIPDIYRNKDDARKLWESQGDFLLAADAARLALTRLAAMTGDAWHEDCSTRDQGGARQAEGAGASRDQTEARQDQGAGEVDASAAGLVQRVGIVQHPFDPDTVVEESVAADAANLETLRRRQEAGQRLRVAQNAFDSLPSTDALVSAVDDPGRRPQFIDETVSALMRIAASLNALGVNPATPPPDVPPHEHPQHMRYALEVLIAACHKGETEARRLLEKAMASPDLAYSIIRHLRSTIREHMLCRRSRLSAPTTAANTVGTVYANQSDEQDEPPKQTPPVENTETDDQTSQSAMTAGGMRWQDVAERLERLRIQGEAWPGYREMARRLNDCSTATVYKAVKSSPELIEWAKRQAAPRAQQSLDNEEAGVKESVIQQREPDPAEDAADAELRTEIEKADPEERSFLNEISGASREFLLWYIEQSSKRRKSCRERWKQLSESDPKVKAWFLGLSAEEQLTFFDDPGSCQGTFPRP
jgi:hypothetical protein